MVQRLKELKKGSIKNLSLIQKLMQPFIINRRENQSYHTILAASEEVKKIFEKVFENNRVEIIGYPRNDVFFDHNLIFENYNEKLNLKKYNKVVLYCPTFRDNPSSKNVFSRNFLKNLNNYLIEMNYVFLIKRHIDDKNIIQTDKLSNVLDISKKVDDVQDLLVYTDIVITDYSSVFFDFGLLDKPIIFYCYDFDEYLESSRELYYDYYSELPGPFAKNENELFQTLKDIENIFKQKEYRENFVLFRSRFNYFNDGKSCERLYNYLK